MRSRQKAMAASLTSYFAIRRAYSAARREAVALRRADVHDAPSLAPPGHQPGPAQHAQVLAHAAGAGLQPAGELLRVRGPLQAEQDARAAAAEQRGERLVAAASGAHRSATPGGG